MNRTDIIRNVCKNSMTNSLKEMLIKSANSHVERKELEKLRCSIPTFMKTFPQVIHAKSAKDFTYIASNQNNLDFFGIESNEELIGLTAFDLKRFIPEQWSDSTEKFVNKIHLQDEEVVRTGKIAIVKSPDEYLNKNGFVVKHLLFKTPLINSDNQTKAVLTLVFDTTASDCIGELYHKYQSAYKKNNQLGNKRFLEYLGISVQNIPINDREIESLISISQYRNAEKAARQLNISAQTLKKYLYDVKLKLRFDLPEILLHFTMQKYRKF